MQEPCKPKYFFEILFSNFFKENRESIFLFDLSKCILYIVRLL